jgi:hypothetical protein
MRGSVEQGARIGAALLLGLTAVVIVLVALQERATGDFLSDLGRTPGLEGDTGSAAHYAAFWFDTGFALAIVVSALLIAWLDSRTWFALGVLVAALGLASGLFALFSAHAEIQVCLPTRVVAIALTALAGLSLLASLLGLVSAPPLATRPPLNPPVPPSHQAG